jgi:ribosomal protein S18 acetylase RimI-like enzyme
MGLLKLVTQPNVSEVRSVSDLRIPRDLSFFEPTYLRHWVNEVLEVGGESYVVKASDGVASGIFVYDAREKTGTIYTRSREVFDCFYGLRPFNFLFAEVRSERESEVYDIYTIDLEAASIDHRFRHEVSMAGKEDVNEIKRFMVSTNSGMNRRWVNVAFRNGDRCIVARLGKEIAGLGWLSLVNDVGRVHSLYVKPQFRGMGMGEDILYARLLWLKSNHARSAFSEISRHNLSSSRVAMKGHMSVSGQIFQYFRTSSNPRFLLGPRPSV